MPAAIVNSNNVIFANGGGSNFPVSASFAVGGVDNSTVSSMTFQIVRPSQTITGITMKVGNELGSSGEFTLIPADSTEVGFIRYNGNKTISITNPATITPVCSAHAMSTGNPSVTFNLPDTLMHFRVTTPYNYDGPQYYTATINNHQYVMESGCYVDFTKAYNDLNELDWHEAGSGYWSL
jgi:hypothetical protein